MKRAWLLSLAAAGFVFASASAEAALSPSGNVREAANVAPGLTLVQDRDRRRDGDRDRRDRDRHYRDRDRRGGVSVQIGPGIGVYAGSRRCGWLRDRAVRSGSRYWWNRYRTCRATR